VVRNHTDGTRFEVGTSGPKHGKPCGSGRSEDTSMEGQYRWSARKRMPRRIPREEVGTTDPGDHGALKESQVHEGRAACRHDDSRNTSKTNPATGKVKEGAGKAKRPATPPSKGHRTVSKEKVRPYAP
jgi:hypothetical protein